MTGCFFKVFVVILTPGVSCFSLAEVNSTLYEGTFSRFKAGQQAAPPPFNDRASASREDQTTVDEAKKS